MAGQTAQQTDLHTGRHTHRALRQAAEPKGTGTGRHTDEQQATHPLPPGTLPRLGTPAGSPQDARWPCPGQDRSRAGCQAPSVPAGTRASRQWPRPRDIPGPAASADAHPAARADLTRAGSWELGSPSLCRAAPASCRPCSGSGQEQVAGSRAGWVRAAGQPVLRLSRPASQSLSLCPSTLTSPAPGLAGHAPQAPPKVAGGPHAARDIPEAGASVGPEAAGEGVRSQGAGVPLRSWARVRGHLGGLPRGSRVLFFKV